jgi:RNA polymerase sigma factor (sigma-70 family)
MYFDKASASELSREEMEQVRTTFAGLLYKQRYHPQFIAKNLEELLATAHLEYVRYAKKEEIEDPVAWTVHCAYRRLQNFLTRNNYAPREVSSEMLGELADQDTPTPAQIAEDTDRARKVRSAIEKLDIEQRQLLALVYFEGLPVEVAADRLGWHVSRAWRLHRMATKRLKALLGVESSDDLEIEIGIAAWLSLIGSGALHPPPGFEAILDKASNEASDIWTRIQHLGRRFHLGGGGEAAGAVASADGGNNVVMCVKAAAFCIASAGVIAHSAGNGIGVLADHNGTPSARQHVVQAQPTDESPIPSSAQVAEAPEEPPVPADTASTRQSSAEASAQNANSPRARASSERRQVREQASGIARASGESQTVSAPQRSSSGTASTSSATPESASPPVSSGGSTGESAQASQQFGAFK